MWRKKRKEHRIFDRIMLAVFLLVASIYTVKFLIGFFLKVRKAILKLCKNGYGTNSRFLTEENTLSMNFS